MITGLFFNFAGIVSASSVAGDSAVLATATNIKKSEIEAISEAQKRMAIKKILTRYNSPMVEEVDSFMKACKKYNLDCYLLPAIAGLESTFGRFIYPQSFNPFGWGRGLIPFKSWDDSIDTVALGLRKNYIDKGADTVEKIGAIYCEGNTWATKVNWFMNKFKDEENKITLYMSQIPVKL